MQDWHNRKAKRQDSRLMGLLKRAIPGEFKRIEEVGHAALDLLEINMMEITTVASAEGAVAKLWQADTVPVRTPPFQLAVSSPGEWVVCVDEAMGAGSLSSLWFFCFCEDVSYLVKRISAHVPNEGQMLLKFHREGTLLAIDGFTLKYLAKRL